MERLKKLQPVVVTHPSFTYSAGTDTWQRWRKTLSPGFTGPGTLVKNGLTAAAGSDSPIVPTSPIMGIYGAVTRLTSAGQVLNATEKLSAAEVIKMYTLNAAYASTKKLSKVRLRPANWRISCCSALTPLRYQQKKLKISKCR